MAPLAFQVDQGPSDGETPPWKILIQNERNQINMAKNQQGEKNPNKTKQTNKKRRGKWGTVLENKQQKSR